MGADEKLIHGAALAADAVDTFSQSGAAKKFGVVGNALGVVADTYSGYKKGGVEEAAVQGGKSTLNTAASIAIMMDQGKNIVGLGTEIKYAADGVKGAAQVQGMAGMAGKMALINSLTTVTSDAVEYARGTKELNMDNWSATTVDTVTALDPLKAVAGIANVTKLFGVDTGIQNASISSGMDKVLGVVGITDGKGEQLGDVIKEVQQLQKQEEERFKAGETDKNYRRVEQEVVTKENTQVTIDKPLMTDYKHLAAAKNLIAKYVLPDGKIDGKDVASEFNEIDFSKPENVQKYRTAINRAMLDKEKTKAENDTSAPSWLRGSWLGGGAEKADRYNDANGDLKILEAAEKEYAMHETKVREYNKLKENATSVAAVADVPKSAAAVEATATQTVTPAPVIAVTPSKEELAKAGKALGEIAFNAIDMNKDGNRDGNDLASAARDIGNLLSGMKVKTSGTEAQMPAFAMAGGNNKAQQTGVQVG